ncbi:HD domain-containing protein [Pseudonocardia charpentierae]|uniref:HD domain-containing protein n=1 Tax=Pseudonocardia charpentierae TaxID=3075545 RepID=A0ABU2NJC8_9PSEU|nr:HD domain-containing protein [Pseudonocardia sp. DSM 45834]MDT0353123.1 HD domain-containing protein [Pseudonocardia sp. DSM 45834]
MTSPTLRLLDWARAHGPEVLDAIGRALVVAQQAHRDEQRRSGDPYITHPVEVALILTEQGAAPETVVTAVLHDVPDAKSPRSVPELRAQFGDVVAGLLLGYTGLDRHPHSPGLRQADRRALQVKVADRLHNMRTIRHLTLASQRQKAEQTRELVAPIARSLGMVELGLELDRLSYATLRSVDEATRRNRGGTSTRSIR